MTNMIDINNLSKYEENNRISCARGGQKSARKSGEGRWTLDLLARIQLQLPWSFEESHRLALSSARGW